MSHILAIGNLVLDTLLDCDHYPNENEEMRAQNRHYQLGGNGANSLSVLAQLGHQTALVATLGDDTQAQILTHQLTERGINPAYLEPITEGQTPNSYVLRNQQNGSRTICHYRNLPEVSLHHFKHLPLTAFDWIHFEARNEMVLPALIAQTKSLKSAPFVSLEVEKSRPQIEALFGQVDLLIFSHHYASQKGYQDGHALLLAMQKWAPQANLVCTWGEQGAWYASSALGKIHHQPAEQIEAIDTLGAGDTFNAGLIHALLAKQPLADAVLFASQLAAKKCQQMGLDGLVNPL